MRHTQLFAYKLKRNKTFGNQPILVVAAAILLLTFSQIGFGQSLSRWALGRPSLLIDMPGDPGGGGVAWAEKPLYSIFPSAWSAEGNGVRVEVARIYTAKSPSDLMAEIGQKMGSPMAPQGRGELSGRSLVNFGDATRMAVVIANDGGVLGGASWAVVTTFKDQAARSLAGAILDSIKVEREGNRHWALRSLGPTFLAAEMPFELTRFTRGSDEGVNRYESSFDGMDVTVTDETPSAGNVFDKETTLKGFVDGYRTRPGITDFTYTRDKYKLGDRDGELITKSFKRGGRSYRIYDIAFIDKRRAVVASIQIDPARAEHQETTQRILRSLKTTLNPIYGWKTYAVGKEGLYVDLPVAPGPPRQLNAVTIYESNTPLAMTEIRELEVGFPGAHDPDFSAKQYFEMRTAIDSKQIFELQGIDKLLVDGLEARLVRSTWRNGQNVNFRRMLIIYGYRTQWIVDMLASKGTEAYMDRVMQSVRVQIDLAGRTRRQSFGQMGVSFVVGDQVLEPKLVGAANDPDFTRQEVTYGQFGGVVLVTYELIFKNENPPLSDDSGTKFVNSFLNGLSASIGMEISAKLRDGFPINIDGVGGRHLILDLTSSKMKKDAVIQGDFVILQQDKKLWTAIVITNYEGGLEARYNRARILNTLRVGM